MSFGQGIKLSGRISQITRIAAVTWFRGHKYERTMRDPNKPIWECFPEFNFPDDLYERKLWGWASFIDGAPKKPRADYRVKAGETIVLCAKCGGFHGWTDGCQY